MKYQDFINEVARRAECSQKEVKNVLTALTEALPQALEEDGRVAIPGLGVFALKARAERMGRNPSTGEVIVIEARREVAFKGAAGLKKAVKGIGIPERKNGTQED